MIAFGTRKIIYERMAFVDGREKTMCCVCVCMFVLWLLLADGWGSVVVFVVDAYASVYVCS